jgi:long-subunit fatty acid transport protein
LDIPSTFNPVGSGARAMGLGGSFIAMADDATAASWNPSALVQLRKPEVAVVYSQTALTEKNKFSVFPEANGDESIDNGDLNYLAFSVPCSAETCGKNMVFSVNYQRLYDLSRSWDFSYSDAGSFITTDKDYTMRQEGALYAIGFAYALQVSDTLSLGATINVWKDGFSNNTWSQNQTDITDADLLGSSTLITTNYYNDYEFSGQNFNLGLLWTAYQKNEYKLTLGLVYKSEFDADIKYKFKGDTELTSEALPDNNTNQDFAFATTSELTMPSSFGIGLAFQWSDNLTTSLDVYRTNWSDFSLVETAEDGSKSPAVFPLNSKSDQNVLDTTQIRIGVEYRIISQGVNSNYIIPIRAGIFKDPAPSIDTTDNIYGLSLGSGISFEEWVFDIAWQYRFGNDLGSSYIPELGFSQDIEEHQVFGSVFYRF